MGFSAMSRVNFSFDSSVAAVLPKPETRKARMWRRPTLPSRRYMRIALENLGLFAFGFGSTTLLIHIVVGFFLASRMSSMLSAVNL